ncbi:hypothetical protein C7974DRAFT_411405 [Boeremia exigua]|uniref:uncharacterized protein n=1 Tax=Boeremia exigua TaxID=749465 RepID=UPI001E8E4D77|nr:uncharacterized protein C7974DRAFT_411405 [Boeremia exigua]KAH6637949.1 hypothetical protein C7974DRAFT_411405 [Boeremia exigua]
MPSAIVSLPRIAAPPQWLDLEEYVGYYIGGGTALIISLEDEVLHLSFWNGQDANYTIKPLRCRFQFRSWATHLFPIARIMSNGQPSDEFNTKVHLISFNVSDSRSQKITSFVWQMPDTTCPRRFVKTRQSPLLKLPQEIVDHIMKFVLTTSTHLKGVIHLHEEKNHFVVAETKSMPAGGEQKRWKGNREDLPPLFNQVQFTCRSLLKSTRGLELQYNVLKCNGWTFDSIRRAEDRPELHHLLYNARQVTLSGDFTLGRHPDENVLHGLIQFGKTHPLTNIRVEVNAMHLNGIRSLKGFVAFALFIREAIRGIPRPRWAQVRQQKIAYWLRGKAPGTLNIPNVVFCPRRPVDIRDDQDFNQQQTYELVRNKGRNAEVLRSHFREEGALVQLLGSDAPKDKTELAILNAKTGADACFELLKHWYTKGI